MGTKEGRARDRPPGTYARCPRPRRVYTSSSHVPVPCVALKMSYLFTLHEGKMSTPRALNLPRTLNWFLSLVIERTVSFLFSLVFSCSVELRRTGSPVRSRSQVGDSCRPRIPIGQHSCGRDSWTVGPWDWETKDGRGGPGDVDTRNQ